MNRNITQYYTDELLKRGFLPDQDSRDYCKTGSTWKLSDTVGGGKFWLYTQPDRFNISIHEFFFHEDTILEFSWPECLSIMLYDSISGEELSPYRRLEAGSVKSYMGGYTSYKVLIHKKIPVRSVGIEIMPSYYEKYLKEQYPGEYTDPHEAFAAVGQTSDFEQMKRLLNQVKAYRGEGMAALLFYEGKATEAVSLIVERNRNTERRQNFKKTLSEQDAAQLENLALYLNDHCIQDIPLEQITKISCMGTRKLQTSFKQYHGCTITEYIQQRRMSQAETLLSGTDIPIGHVAQSVGYRSSSRFSELFRKSTGLLPGEFRKMAQRK